MLLGLALVLFGVPLFVMTAPLVVLPPRARRAAARNCFRSDRSFSRHRASHEARAIIDLGGTMFVVLLIVLAPLAVAAVAVHSSVIPIPLAIEAVQTDFSNSEAWELNPRRGPYESIAQRHERFVLSRGGTLQDARAIQKVLWTTAPFVAIVWVASMFVLAGWICRLSRVAFCEYHQGLRTRTMILHNKRHAATLCKQPAVAARRRYLTGSGNPRRCI